MSKIEEALRRARSERQEAAGAEGAAPLAQPQPMLNRSLDARSAVSSSRRELVGVTAAEEIARMQEDWTRDPADLAAKRIISKDMEDVRVRDAFRHLRTQLLQKSAGKNAIVMVTSVARGGGSSFVSLNLGAAIAFDEGKTATVLNCNLHNSALDSLVKNPAEASGLTDYLAGREQNVENIIHPIGIPRLRLVPVGQQGRSTMEYFTAPALTQLLHSLRQRYRERFIIIDAPPIAEAADARILAELCDYTLLVVPYGRVTKGQVAAAASGVPKDKLLGCVLNDETRVPLLSRGSRGS